MRDASARSARSHQVASCCRVTPCSRFTITARARPARHSIHSRHATAAPSLKTSSPSSRGRAASNDCSTCAAASAWPAPWTATDKSRSEPGPQVVETIDRLASHNFQTRAMSHGLSSSPMQLRTGIASMAIASLAPRQGVGTSSKQSTSQRATPAASRRPPIPARRVAGKGQREPSIGGPIARLTRHDERLAMPRPWVKQSCALAECQRPGQDCLPKAGLSESRCKLVASQWNSCVLRAAQAASSTRCTTAAASRRPPLLAPSSARSSRVGVCFQRLPQRGLQVALPQRTHTPHRHVVLHARCETPGWIATAP
jgi:hypothetical protein